MVVVFTAFIGLLQTSFFWPSMHAEPEDIDYGDCFFFCFIHSYSLPFLFKNFIFILFLFQPSFFFNYFEIPLSRLLISSSI